ncbi:hypothetical protein ACH4C2_36485 [Streptomyces sp. NPDC018057]
MALFQYGSAEKAQIASFCGVCGIMHLMSMLWSEIRASCSV